VHVGVGVGDGVTVRVDVGVGVRVGESGSQGCSGSGLHGVPVGRGVPVAGGVSQGFAAFGTHGVAVAGGVFVAVGGGVSVGSGVTQGVAEGENGSALTAVGPHGVGVGVAQGRVVPGIVHGVGVGVGCAAPASASECSPPAAIAVTPLSGLLPLDSTITGVELSVVVPSPS
jgi:hypothetical protein